jgi:glycine/D-amino acid oxidase-like deaminating enzyme
MPISLHSVESDPALPASADVVIVGGGIIGVSAAYFLARNGHSVAIVEKGVVGGEQSGRNWGWCRQQNRDERELELAKKSLDLWETLQSEINADLGFKRALLLFVTKDPQDLARWEKWAKMARTHEVSSRMLSAAEARGLTPGCEETWIGGVHCLNDGQAEPGLAAPRIAEAARRAGATLHQMCAVRGLDIRGGRVSGVVTEKGIIRSSAVLCAAGAWSSLLCRHHGIDLPQASIRATAFRTTAGPEVIEGGLATPNFVMRRRQDGGYTIAILGRGGLELTPQGLRYARAFWPTYLERRKKIKIGIGRSFFHGPEALSRWSVENISPFERDRTLDPEADMSIVNDAMAELRHTYPGLKDLRVSESWGGWIDSTPDALPVISPVTSLPGFFLATGFSGHGFGVGPGAGQLAADLITGDEPFVDPAAFIHERLIDGRDLGKPGMM